MTEPGPGTDPLTPEDAGQVVEPTRDSKRTTWIIVAAVGALVVIALVVWALVVRAAPAGHADASASATASASPPPSSSPTASETPSASPSPVVSSSPSPTVPTLELPTDCSAIYSGPMFASLRALQLPLNDPSLADETGTAIPELDTLLRANPGLHCSWGLPSELGINTNVTLIDPAAAQNIEATLVARGATCEEKDDGTLCTLVHVGPGIEDWAEGDPQAGENHFFRDNAWIATHWSTVEMNGYTPDIVHTLWP